MSEQRNSAQPGAAPEEQDRPAEAGKDERAVSGEAGEAQGGVKGTAEARPVSCGESTEAQDSGVAEEGSIAAQLEAVRAELAEQRDHYLRAVAEAENIRRRADNEVANARKFAVEAFASEILAVRDSLEIARSLEISEDDAGAVAKMKEGLDLTLRQLDSALAKFSIAVVDPQRGDKLDPERHQAMTAQESDKVPPNHILAVMQKGYTIHDRLLRPAMVVVARKPQNAVKAEGETA